MILDTINNVDIYLFSALKSAAFIYSLFEKKKKKKNNVIRYKGFIFLFNEWNFRRAFKTHNK